jgi:hypothetical protein
MRGKFCSRNLVLTIFASGIALAGPSLMIAAADNNPVGDALSSKQELLGQAASNPAAASADLLSRVRQSADEVYASLSSFVCRENIERYKGAAHDMKGHQVDRITSMVSYENDTEHYTEILQNRKERSRIAGMSGAWTEGEYETFLREAQKALNSRLLELLPSSVLDGMPAAVFMFDANEHDSPWDFATAQKHYILPFRGQIWVSPETGEILQIDRISTEVPAETGIASVNWSVHFGDVSVNGKNYRLPTKAVYSVTYVNSDRHEWNIIALSDYKRFGSEVVLRFQ